jgi:hypothetical protein
MFGCIFNYYKPKKPEKTMDKNIYNFYPKQENTKFINNVELPKEWIEKCSISGETYWYNVNTHEKTFTKPKKQIHNINSL